MDVKEHVRLPIPDGVEIDEIKAWCRKWLNDRVKIKYHRKYDPTTGKWGRDYNREPVLRFSNDADAVAFKIQWTER